MTDDDAHLAALLAEADVGLLDPVRAGTAVSRLTSDYAFLGHLLEIEATWTEVLADAGIVPTTHATAGRRAADPAAYDLVALAHQARAGGNPLIPALGAMRKQVLALTADSSAADSFHIGATSQDVVDTAMMLMISETSKQILADLRRAARALVDLARAHRDTPMMARTLGQFALPTTFGLRAAGWLTGLTQAGQQLEAAVSSLPLQWGGAAGTQAHLSARVAAEHRGGSLAAGTGALELSQDLAHRLGLQTPPAPWHAMRIPVTTVASALASAVAASGKVSEDVLLAARIEIGELREPPAPGRGASSAMPHKRNPVLSVLIHSAALSAPSLLTQVVTAAGAAREERPDGAWHAEWAALRSLLRTAGGVADCTAELLAGLEVDRERMTQNLVLTDREREQRPGRGSREDTGLAGALVDRTIDAHEEWSRS